MSRAVASIVAVAVVAAAAGLAYWAIRGADDGSASRDAPAVGTASPAGGDAAATDVAKPGGRARTDAAGAAADDAATQLAGVVVTTAGKPVAGASVECFAVPVGAPDDALGRAREAFRGVLDDDRDLDALLRQVGARDEEPTPEQTMRMMRSGRRIGARLAADPAALARAGRIARDVAAGLESDSDLERIAATSAGADGSFRFVGLAPGKVELRVTAPLFQRRKTRAAVGDATVKVELEPAGVVAGEVRHAGEPVAGAEVRFRARTVRTGPDGRFRHDGARPPREPVIVSAPGCVTRGEWAPVVLGAEPEPIVIELDAAGSVSGRVSARDGAPLAGVTITFPADAGAMFQMMMPLLGGDRVPVPPPSARTDESGAYRLDGVPARTVRLSAEREGYLAATVAGVRVPAGGIVERVDFVLGRASAIEGRIVDAAGAPVADAEVRVQVPGAGPMRMAAQFLGGIERASRSGADGTYRVGGLPEGSRDVVVEAEGFLDGKATVALAAEATARQDFTLRPGLRISGHVLDPDGAPVPGATLRVYAKRTGAPANPMLAAFADFRTAVTDAAGAFTAAGLQEGPYRVVGAAPRFLEAVVEGVEPGAEDVVVRLGAAATIRGVVVAEESGNPVAGARVFRRDPAARRSGNPMLDFGARDPSTAAGADGRFEFGGVVPGAWEVYARAPGYADSARVKVAAAAGAAAEGISLALPPGATVAGHVLRKADGSGLEGALVWVRTDPSPVQAPNVAEILGDVPTPPPDAITATTAADGSFALDGLTPGKATLEVRAAGFAPRTLAATEVPNASVVAEMSAGGALTGAVLDREGRPSEGQTVILQQGMMGMGYLRTSTTDRRGEYAIERIPPGSYSVLLLDAESPMGMAGMSSVAIRDGETTRHDFSRKTAGSPVEGKVLAEGKPVAGATVLLIGGSTGMLVASTEEDGTFRFDHADAGEYQVMVQTSALGGGSDATKVTVAADGTVSRVSVELSSLAVEGTVVDSETAKPVPFAQAVLVESGGGGSLQEVIARQKGQAITDDQGRFVIRGVPKGTYSLRVTAGGYAESSVDGVAGGGPAVRVQLSRGAELAVTVLGPDGKPVAGANVVPEDASGRTGLAMDFSMSKVTGADGVARLRLQPGSYRLHVGASGHPSATVAADTGSGAVTVRLEAGGTLEVTVRDGSGAAVKGASVKVLDAAGAEVRDALTISNFLGTGGTTDAAGRARREGLRPGRVTVVVRSPSGKEARADAVVTAGGTADVSVVVD